MAINLLDLVKGQLNDNLIGQAANLIGESKSATSSALGSLLPTLLGSIVSKGSTQSGAASLLNLINTGNHDGGILDDLPNLFSSSSASSGLMNTGKALLSTFFGNRQNSILDKLVSLTGLGRNSTSSFLSLLAPVMMGLIGKQVRKSNLDAGGLMSLLKGQQSMLNKAMPAGMGSLLGFADSTGSSSHSSSTGSGSSSSGGGGMLKWLLLGLAALLLLGWLFRSGCSGSTSTAADSDGSEVEMTDNTVGGTQSVKGIRVDASGNLVDGNGTIVARAGQYSKDANGNIVDANGNIIYKASDATSIRIPTAGTVSSSGNGTSNSTVSVDTERPPIYINENGDLVTREGKVLATKGNFKEQDGYYVDNDGNRLGKIFKAIGKAIGDAAEATGKAVGKAAEKTGEFFQKTFTGIFKKKDRKGYTYTLADITFNPENHRITDFSKAEVEGLAAALKMDKDAKIQVQAHTNDASGKEAKKLTDTRAKVVQQMLITLGVNKNQISAKGMGDENKTKAAGDKIEIMVE